MSKAEYSRKISISKKSIITADGFVYFSFRVAALKESVTICANNIRNICMHLTQFSSRCSQFVRKEQLSVLEIQARKINVICFTESIGFQSAYSILHCVRLTFTEFTACLRFGFHIESCRQLLLGSI